MRCAEGIYWRDSWMADGLWKSNEDEIILGTVRIIREKLYYAWTIYRTWRWQKWEISWLPVEPKHIEDRKLFPPKKGQF